MFQPSPRKKSSQYDEIMVLVYAFLCLNYKSVIINNKSKWKDPTNIKFEFNLNLLFFISPKSIWRVPLGRSRPPEVKQIRNYYNIKKSNNTKNKCRFPFISCEVVLYRTNTNQGWFMNFLIILTTFFNFWWCFSNAFEIS